MKIIEWIVYIALQPIAWLFDFLLNIGDDEDDNEREHLVSSNIERLTERAIVLLEFSDEKLEENISEVDSYLEDLALEVNSIKKKSKGLMRGDVYFDGTALIEISDAISQRLEGLICLLDQYSKATGLLASSVLSVAPHYHHMVGPAMIANGIAKEKMNELEYSMQAYRAVISDFVVVLERAERDNYRPVQDDLVSIESLNTAINRLSALDEKEGRGLSDLSQRVTSVLEKEKDPNILEGPIVVLVRSNGRIKCSACGWSLVFSENDKHCRSCGIEHIFEFESA